MTRIAVLDDYQNVALSSTDWTRLPGDAQVEVFHDHLFDEDALVERLQSFDVICGMRERTPFTGSLVRRLPNLKLLITTGARNASFDMPALREQGVVACGTMGGPRGTTSELAWALLLALAKKVTKEDADVRAGGWQLSMGESLDGKTLGVIGLGNLGSHVAKIGLVFNMNVIAWSQNLTQEKAEAIGARLVSKAELMSQSDYISVHLVLSERSRGIVSRDDIASMKPSAYLINTARGPIVDEDALLEALQDRRIAGAGLDVFSVEPLPLDNPFRSLDNVVITPHLGYVTTESYRSFFDQTVENILGFLDGKPVRVVQ